MSRTSFVSPCLGTPWSRALATLGVVLVALCAGCSAPSPTPDANSRGAESADAGAEGAAAAAVLDPVCPVQAPAPARLPGVRPEHEELSYWLDRLREQGLLDTPLMDAAEVRAHSAALVAAANGRHALHAPPDADALATRLSERREWMNEQVERGVWFRADGGPADHLRTTLFDAVALAPEPTVRAVLTTTQVRCYPSPVPMYTASLDLRFNRNHCSSIHPQEPVRVLGRGPDAMVLIEAEYTWGWIDGLDALSAPLTADASTRWLDAPRHSVDSVAGAADLPIAVGRVIGSLPSGEPGVVDRDGRLHGLPATVRTTPTARPLTREAFLRVAFSFAGAPYGWGGHEGGRDCSRFLQDAFEAFGLTLPRHSVAQSVSGSFHVDLTPELPESDRERLLDVLHEHGVVLIHFPGHIMLYLGRDEDGRSMGLHAFAEYVEPCAEAGREGNTETLREVAVAGVSDLELGRGSSRRAFIERMTRLTVIGAPPDERVHGIATRRAAAAVAPRETCERGAHTIFVSPAAPVVGEPVRLIGTPLETTRPRRVDVWTPGGDRHTTADEWLGGPPWALAATYTPTTPGVHIARLGDGPDELACVRFDVAAQRRPPAPSAGGGPVWRVTTTWGPQTEALYAAFVEKLFDYPIEEDVSWTNLQSVLQNADNNLLYNHFGLNEEHRLRLEPDCADLPYFLRAYFAWKLGLPFSYRRCSRGRAGRPPTCGEPLDNLQTRERPDDVDAFGRFAQGPVRNTAHSSSGRTLPLDEASDFYPVEMSRTGIRPGTVYHDPYGHVMIVTRWLPQTLDGWGVLMAADAQPDKTIGRRRFWRGTFLFVTETNDVGAGFKAWRPVVVDRAAGGTRQLDNAEIQRGDHVSARGISPFSLAQYEGSLDDFYDRMDALINPRPLDPWSVQVSLIDALEESAVRRVQSIDTSEDWMRRNRFPVMDMPTGSSIFLTSGPWEDFSTPSRDLRLLVAIDAVRDFAERMRRQPERFDLSPQDAPAAVAHLIERRDTELAARTFPYTRSDGSVHTLSLADVLQRAVALEVAYNPNDCPEVRWGAESGSDEMRTCRGRAPAAHRARMEEYRDWFRTRQRPSR